MAGKPTSIRRKLLSWLGMLIVLSLLSSTLSLFRITEVNKSLGTINQVSVPLGRSLVQLKADADTYRREIERRFGARKAIDDNPKFKSPPQWIIEMVNSDLDRLGKLTQTEGLDKWKVWVTESKAKFLKIQNLTLDLIRITDQGQSVQFENMLRNLTSSLSDWSYQIEWAVVENERNLRSTFSIADDRVASLKRALAFILGVVACLSLILFWLGEKALRPLEGLTELAREITRRGLRKEDKSHISLMTPDSNDEVSQLATEFHRMTTAILEREKEIETQKQRLTEQNKQLIQLGELKEKLKNAEKLAAIGKLSAQVAHEVRNPLHSIGLEAEMALDRAKADPVLSEGLKSILVSVERLQKITENYLKMSKLSKGKKETIDLSDVLESTLASYATQTQAMQIKVDWNLDSGQGPFWIWADLDLLEQVLGNLMKNAIQALEDVIPKMITWSLSRDLQGHVCISIEDSGHGFKDEVRQNLFTPFYTTKASGTGLGLSLVKQVLDDHGAQVALKEKSKFEIIFPQMPPVNLPSKRKDNYESDSTSI